MKVKNYENLACVHDKGKIIQMFTEPEEALAFADKIEKKTQVRILKKVVLKGKKLSCDPLYNVLNANRREGYWEGVKETRE